VYNLPRPFEQIRIFVPAGAWPQARRDSSGSLKVALLLLPDSLAVPGEQNGPAVAMAPLNFNPLKPVILSLPVDQTAMNKSRIPAMFTRNLSVGDWYKNSYPAGGQLGNASVFAEISDFSLHASFWISPDETIATSEALTNKNVLIIGAVVGSAAALFLASVAFIFRDKLYLRRSASSDPDLQPPDLRGEASDLINEIDKELQRHSMVGLDVHDLD
jgi:hypothetical protein